MLRVGSQRVTTGPKATASSEPSVENASDSACMSWYRPTLRHCHETAIGVSSVKETKEKHKAHIWIQRTIGGGSLVGLLGLVALYAHPHLELAVLRRTHHHVYACQEPHT